MCTLGVEPPGGDLQQRRLQSLHKASRCHHSPQCPGHQGALVLVLLVPCASPCPIPAREFQKLFPSESWWDSLWARSNSWSHAPQVKNHFHQLFSKLLSNFEKNFLDHHHHHHHHQRWSWPPAWSSPPTPGASMLIALRSRMSGFPSRCRCQYMISYPCLSFIFDITLLVFLYIWYYYSCNFQRSMAAEAEATRDARAKVGE